MLNVLLAWALEQRELLDFDLSKLCKVHLSIGDYADEDGEPWNHIVSGKLYAGGPTFPEVVWGMFDKR